METTETMELESGIPVNHTQSGLLWIGAILLLSWKPELLDHLLAVPDALAAAVVKLLESALIF